MPTLRRIGRVIRVPRPGRSPEVPKVSIPILTAMVSVYNSSKWLNNRIINLLETKIYKRNQLLIYLVNAESHDQQDDIICKTYTNTPNIIYENIPHCTVYAAWNWIIKRTNTPYLTNANTDDLISPEAYDIMIDGCANQKADLSYCSWYTIGEGPKHWSDISGRGEAIGHYNPDVGQMSCGHFPLWKRTIHDRIGLFDPEFVALGDADLWYRAWQNGIRNFLPINAPYGAYRWRDGQNLWHRAPEDKRTSEWLKVSSRGPGKLEFE